MNRLKHLGIASFAFLITLTACQNLTQTEPIRLRNPATGQITQCGPFPTILSTDKAQSLARERACIEDFQRQGFERVP